MLFVYVLSREERVGFDGAEAFVGVKSVARERAA